MIGNAAVANAMMAVASAATMTMMTRCFSCKCSQRVSKRYHIVQLYQWIINLRRVDLDRAVPSWIAHLFECGSRTVHFLCRSGIKPEEALSWRHHSFQLNACFRSRQLVSTIFSLSPGMPATTTFSPGTPFAISGEVEVTDL